MNESLSFYDYMFISKDIKLYEQMMMPGVLELLLLGDITTDQLKTATDPVLVKLLEIGKKQEERAKRVNIEDSAGNVWLQRMEVIRFGRQSDFKTKAKIIHISLLVILIVYSIAAHILNTISKRAVTSILESIAMISVYLLVYDYISHRANLMADPSPPLSLLKRIVCVATTVFCLWIDPILRQYDQCFTISFYSTFIALGLSMTSFRLRIEQADKLANDWSLATELSGARDFLIAKQKRNQEKRQKSWWNSIVYNDKGDYRLSISKPSLSSRINGIVKKL